MKKRPDTLGARSRPMLQHRSIWSLKLPAHRLATGLFIALSFTVLLLSAHESIGLIWSRAVTWWLAALGLPGDFRMPRFDDAALFSLPVPIVDLRIGDSDLAVCAAHGLACIAVWFVAGWLPDNARPATYLLRFMTLVDGASAAYFAIWPGRFPHDVTSHVAGGLRQSWALMLITPWLHLLTYYLFPFAIGKRVALTAITLAYLFVLAPLQYACHAALIHAAGIVIMPLLYLVFGAMIGILGLVGLYGWGMSWNKTSIALPAGGGSR